MPLWKEDRREPQAYKCKRCKYGFIGEVIVEVDELGARKSAGVKGGTKRSERRISKHERCPSCGSNQLKRRRKVEVGHQRTFEDFLKREERQGEIIKSVFTVSHGQKPAIVVTAPTPNTAAVIYSETIKVDKDTAISVLEESGGLVRDFKVMHYRSGGDYVYIARPCGVRNKECSLM